MYNATKEAREYVLKHNKPIILEAMTYRVSHHSTSDDSTAYRQADEVEVWNTQHNPINKLKNYLIKQGWFDENAENENVKSNRKQILSQIVLSEKLNKPDWKEMFYDVYYELPQHLKDQMAELEDHLGKHKEHYPLDKFGK